MVWNTLLLFIFVSSSALAQTGFTLQVDKGKKKVRVYYDKKLVTAYCWFDSTEKPVLFPIKTLTGNTITRGFPISPRPGERADHPHHVGLWFNYESVNGLDFWNNSSAISPGKKNHYGSIRHQEIVSSQSTKTGAALKTRSNWVDPAGNVLLEEMTEFKLKAEHGALIIDRTCTLRGVAPEVVFQDVKDGLIGLRVARQLEMPSQQADTFVDALGNATTVKKLDNEGVTGMYVNREGLTGDDTWGKRSQWTCLNGQKDGENISVVIIDHPKNIGYPTYWHARGYGLFAANPLGQKVFSDGKEELNFKLAKDQQAIFRYRVVIYSGPESLKPSEIDMLMNDFVKE